MYIKDVQVGKTYQMGAAVFTVAHVSYVPGQGVTITATGDDVIVGHRFHRVGLTTVTEVK